MLTSWLLVGFALLLIALSGLFVAAEFSLITVSRTSVERAVAEKMPGAVGTQTALRSLSTQLSGAQVGITITNLLIGWVAEPSIATLISGPLTRVGVPEDAVPGVALTLALLLATALTMVFGELVPQNLALAHPFTIARIVQAPQRWFTAASRPLTVSLNQVSNQIVRWFGVEPKEELASARSPEELVSVVRASARSGHLPTPTADLVERSLRFEGLQARDVLTPRTKVISVAASDPVQRVIDLAAAHGISRFPVSGTDFDDIVGVVELSRAIGVPSGRRLRQRVRDIAMAPVLVPHTARLDEVLWALRERDAELAVVLDEYGGTAGIASLEDLVEELIGEINDEHDPVAESVRDSSDGWLVSGLLRPDELRNLTGLRLPEHPQRYETIAGLVLYSLGRMPVVGDTVTIDVHAADDGGDPGDDGKVDGESVSSGGLELRVEGMDGHRIDLLRVIESSDGARPDGQGSGNG